MRVLGRWNPFRMTRIDPPGSWCQYDAVLRAVRAAGGRTFLEVGCGAGELSARLCRAGLTGVGIDFSPAALDRARAGLARYVAGGRFALREGDIFDLDRLPGRYDLGLSMMVMEHVADDVGFVRKIASFLNPGGHALLAVPGRRDRWGIEDETVGHLRRYDRADLKRVLEAAGLEDVRVTSVAVPVANLLFRVSNLLIRRSGEGRKRGRPLREQTAASGVRDIPFKTVFPAAFKAVLNPVTLYPLLLTQRLFAHTDLGLTQLGVGRVPAGGPEAR